MLLIDLDLAPTPLTTLIGSATAITEEVPVVGNVTICIDSLYTSGRAGVNFCCSPNKISQAFFLTSFALGIMGATSSDVTLVTSATGIPLAGWVGSLGARGCNR